MREPKPIKASEASRAFSDLLDEVETASASFVIERRGRPVALVVPVDTRPRRRVTVGELFEAISGSPRIDDAFASDLEAIRDSAGPPPADPWESS